MSTYYTQWCKEHGEWSMDIDNPGECPECERLGLTEVQRLRRQVIDLETELSNCQITIKSFGEELTNLKSAFARLREGRDRLQDLLEDWS